MARYLVSVDGKDFDIEIPKIVINNIAKVVEVSADFELSKQ